MPRASTRPTTDTSKLNKKELERLLHTREAEYQELSEKLERSRKKRKRLQKALDTNQVLGESDDLIPYPTGEVPGRGDCQLIDLIGQDKATYNAFAMCVRESAIAAGIPKTSYWNDITPVALGEVYDVVREQYPWLAQFKNSWPIKSVLQFLKNNRSAANRERREAARHPPDA